MKALTTVFILAMIATASIGESLPERFSPPDPTAVSQTMAVSDLECSGGMAGIYPCQNVDLLAFVPLASVGCGTAAVVWGWTDPNNSSEYALLACNNGVSFVDITVPTAPVYLGRLPGQTVNSSWRDVKTIGNWAFVGSEASGHGVQIFDLTRLRSVVSPPVIFSPDAHYAAVGRSHTLATNEQTGYLYASGSQTTCGGDLHMIDVSNPLAPQFAGCLELNGYIHESQCVTYHGPDFEHEGKEICFNFNGRFDSSDTIGIDDVTDKNAPVQLARVGYPGAGYTHQGWLTEDHQYLLVNDEFDEQDFGHNSRTYVWDVTDLDSPELVGHFDGRTEAIDHNLYIRGSYAFESNYRAGLSVLHLDDLSTASLTEYGYFDIYPSNDLPEFNGAWGNYPFFPSGNVVVSGIEQGLFVLRPAFLPTVSVNDITVIEGTGSNRSATFTITLSAPLDKNVLVSFGTVSGTATAGEDFVPVSGSIVISAGQTTRTRAVTIIGDDIPEGDETFTLEITSAVNAEVLDSSGTATIIDDDNASPVLSIGDVAIDEGDEGITTTSLAVSLSTVPTEPVDVDWSTSDGSASSPADYVAAAGSIRFEAGETRKWIPISIHGDMDIEPNETFSVVLSNPSGGVIGDATGVVTIVNDDLLTVASIEPTAGPAAGGTMVTIQGSRFDPEATVHFGEEHINAMEVNWISESQIQAVTPALEPASLNTVHVHNPMIMGPNPEPNHRATLQFFSQFLDVSSSYGPHSFIEILFRLGVTSGCGGGNYCPNSTLRRDQMAVLLLRSKFSQTFVPPPATGIFADVSTNDPFAPWIEALYNEGITGGCATEPLRFCPASPVSRAQMSVFLLRGKHGTSYVPPPATGSMFEDVSSGAFAAQWIEQLASEGITSGCSASPSLFCPDSAATRGQIAVFLVRAFGLSPD